MEYDYKNTGSWEAMAGVGTWQYDPTTRQFLWSDSVRALLRTQEESLPNKLETFFKTYGSPKSASGIDQFSELLQTEESIDIMLTLRHSDSRKSLPVRCKAKLLINEDGSSVWHGLFQDISGIDVDSSASLQESLNERVKELRCVYTISSIAEQSLSPEELLSRVVTEIPSGFQYPELTKAWISYSGRVYGSDGSVKEVAKGYPGVKDDKSALLEHVTTTDEGELRVIISVNKSGVPSNAKVYLDEEKKLLETVVGHIKSSLNRHHTSQKLRESEQHYRAYYEAQTNYVIRTDLEGRYTYVNKMFIKHFGWMYPDGQIIGKSGMDSIMEYDHQKVFEAVQACLSDPGAIIKIEIDKPLQDGNVCTTIWDFVGITNDEGVVNEIQCTGIDITGQKELERLLEKATRLSRVGSWEIDLDAETVYLSPMAKEIYELEDYEELHLSEAINYYREDYRDKVTEYVRQGIESGKSWDFEYPLITAKGNERWVRGIGQAEFRGGKCVRLYGSIQDIHRTKSAEVRLSNTSDNIPGAVFQYAERPDGKTEIHQLTQGAKILWGYSAEECMQNIDLIWEQTRKGGDFQKVTESIQESKVQKTRWHCQYRSLRPDGKLMWHEGFGTPRDLPDGTTIWDSIVVDITDQKEAEIILNQKTRQLNAIAQVNSELLEYDHWFDVINKSFAIVGEAVHADRVYYFENSIDNDTGEMFTSQKLEWNRDQIEPQVNNPFLKRVPYSAVPYFFEPLSKGLPYKTVVSRLPDSYEKEQLELQDIKSILVLPIRVMDKFWGFIGFDDCTTEREWTEDEISFLETITANLATAIHKHETDRSLQELYEERNSILQSISDAFYSLDSKWNFRYFNREAELLLEKKADEVLGKNIFEVFPAVWHTELHIQYRQAIESGFSAHFEYYYPVQKTWYDVTVYPASDGISVYFKNITEQKQALEVIRQSNERFRKVMKATSDALWDWEFDKDTVFWGEGYNVLFGYSLEENPLPLNDWEKYIHPDDKDATIASQYEVIENPDLSKWQAEYRYRKIDGTYAYVIDRGLVIRDAQGVAVRMVGAMTDITNQKNYVESLRELNESLARYVQELEMLNAELEQFAFIASHDLQEPLRMISSFLHQLERKYGDKLDDKARQYISFAMEGSGRMKQIILDLLDYSRAGKQADNLELIDLNKVMSDYQSLRRKVLEESGGKIAFDSLPEIEWYRAPLVQTMHSLLDNALKYVSADVSPHVELKVEKSGRYWKFSISDNGIGIDEEHFDKIFVMFQRLHARGEYSGTGMGLALVKKNVKSWGGEISVESAPGKGSTFSFTVPVNKSGQRK